MNDLLLHPATQKQLDNYLAKPSHAITLVAPTGSGKHSVAIMLAAKLLNVESEQLVNQPYFKLLASPDGKAIGIESIRELEHFLSLKVPSHAQLHRVVVIEDIDLLTIEAQNAFLKTLEEPPLGSVFILTTSHDQSLLPTIRSRSPRIIITRPNFEELKAHFETAYSDPKQVNQAMMISGGLPGLAEALLNQNTSHPLWPATILARQLLSETTYERLLHGDELAKDRPLFLNCLFILQQMAHLSLLTASSSSSSRWLSILKATYQAQASLLANVQAKLVVSDLMLQL